MSISVCWIVVLLCSAILSCLKSPVFVNTPALMVLQSFIPVQTGVISTYEQPMISSVNSAFILSHSDVGGL